MTKFQAVTTVFINSCLEDRRTSLMRCKRVNLYLSSCIRIMVRKLRSMGVAGTLFKGKEPASASFSLSWRKSACMAFIWCNVLVIVPIHITSCWQTRRSGFWHHADCFNLPTELWGQYGGGFSWLSECSGCIVLQSNSQGRKHCLHAGPQQHTFWRLLQSDFTTLPCWYPWSIFSILLLSPGLLFQELLHTLTPFHFIEVASCYRLNASVPLPPNPYVEALNPNVIVFGPL